MYPHTQQSPTTKTRSKFRLCKSSIFKGKKSCLEDRFEGRMRKESCVLGDENAKIVHKKVLHVNLDKYESFMKQGE
jgi:hypothetical protein